MGRGDLAAWFREDGIPEERLRFKGADVPRLYLESFSDVDIALDPFPYNGGSTTLDTLWMGVPLVTLAGRADVQRTGASLLSAAGLPDLIAHTPEEYIQAALFLVQAYKNVPEFRRRCAPSATNRRSWTKSGWCAAWKMHIGTCGAPGAEPELDGQAIGDARASAANRNEQGLETCSTSRFCISGKCGRPRTRGPSFSVTVNGDLGQSIKAGCEWHPSPHHSPGFVPRLHELPDYARLGTRRHQDAGGAGYPPISVTWLRRDSSIPPSARAPLKPWLYHCMIRECRERVSGQSVSDASATADSNSLILAFNAAASRSAIPGSRNSSRPSGVPLTANRWWRGASPPPICG